MATIITRSELARRAFAWLCAKRAEAPQKKLAELVEEAGMRFNLGPADAAALERLCAMAEQGRI